MIDWAVDFDLVRLVETYKGLAATDEGVLWALREMEGLLEATAAPSDRASVALSLNGRLGYVHAWLLSKGLRSYETLHREMAGVDTFFEILARAPNTPLLRCRLCQKDRLPSHYTVGRQRGDCKYCRSRASRAKRALGAERIRIRAELLYAGKLCTGCDVCKPAADFARCKAGLGGLAIWCRACVAGQYASSLEGRTKSRESMRRWREQNREEFRARMRVANFERRFRQKVASDGTVTRDFLHELYATVACFYCGLSTPEGQRSADHKTPLSRG